MLTLLPLRSYAEEAIRVKLLNPRPFLLLGSQYSGSSMLAYALDSHIDIRCDRAEPFGLRKPEFNPVVKLVKPADRIRLALKAYGYAASGCKVQSDQLVQKANDADAVRAAILELKPVVIRLTRDTISQVVSRLTRAGLATMTLVPSEVIEQYRYYAQARQAADEWLVGSQLTWTHISYEDLTASENDLDVIPPHLSSRLCSFLGVADRPLTVPFSRRPPTVVSNWDEVKTALEREGIAGGDKG